MGKGKRKEKEKEKRRLFRFARKHPGGIHDSPSLEKDIAIEQ